MIKITHILILTSILGVILFNYEIKKFNFRKKTKYKTYKS